MYKRYDYHEGMANRRWNHRWNPTWRTRFRMIRPVPSRPDTTVGGKEREGRIKTYSNRGALSTISAGTRARWRQVEGFGSWFNMFPRTKLERDPWLFQARRGRALSLVVSWASICPWVPFISTGPLGNACNLTLSWTRQIIGRRRWRGYHENRTTPQANEKETERERRTLPYPLRPERRIPSSFRARVMDIRWWRTIGVRRCVRNVSGEKLVPVNGDPCWPSRGEINHARATPGR